MGSALALVERWPPGATAGVLASGNGLTGDGPRLLGVTGDTRQARRWASVTKPVTALATLVAVERGVLGLDESAGPPGASVRHLLAHASGLAFDDDRVLASPGQRRIYSNTGFEVLGAEVATRVGVPFERHLRQAVLEPLGLRHTRLEGSPASGLVGSLDDLLTVATELLAPTVISAATLGLATTVAFPGLGGVLPGYGFSDAQDWGLGLELRSGKWPHWTARRCSPATFGHFGASGSFVWVDPALGLAAAALSGQPFGPWATRMWPAFSDAVLDEFATTS